MPAYNSRERLVVTALVLLVAAVVIASAWLGDDAYILLRTVDNALNGHGLRWNIAERVQSYTCPLWTLLLSLIIGMTREFYYTTLIVSLLATALTVAGLLRLARSPQGAALALLALLLSKAFVDYSSSGLENPLTHLLVLAFVAALEHPDLAPTRRTGLLALLTALLALNRLDAVVLVAPALAYHLWQQRSRRPWAMAGLGLMPLLAWEGFSLLYYGFAFPNTAYAKLYTAIPRGELWTQGMVYLLDSLTFDPVTLPLMAGTALAAGLSRQPSLAALMAGPLLYAVYAVSVGGDFMSGRFFSASVVLSAAVLALWPWRAQGPKLRWQIAALWAMLMIILGFQGPFPAPLALGDYRASDEWGVVGKSGIADERGMYYRYTGLLSSSRQAGPLTHEWARQGQNWAGKPAVEAEFSVGFMGFYAGPAVHIVDRLALNDALLARLPAKKPWRIGHFERALPAGYLESLRTGRNQLADPQIARLYAQIQRITRGPLWDAQRWRDIRDLHID
jgi:arabinofuranosyltransferase